MTDYFIASFIDGITYTVDFLLLLIVLTFAYYVFEVDRTDDDDDDEGGGTLQPVYVPTRG